MMKVEVMMMETIKRTQTKLDINSDHYYIFKTDIILTWNKTHMKENKVLPI